MSGILFLWAIFLQSQLLDAEISISLSIAVGAVIAMNFCNYGCLNYRRSLGEALIIDGPKLKNRKNQFRKNLDEYIPKESGRNKSEQNFQRKIKTTKKWKNVQIKIIIYI